jgi:hypothetical protein
MKGGKAGRKKRAADSSSGRPGNGRGKPKGSAKRHSEGPPKKGSRKKPYGGASSSGEE